MAAKTNPFDKCPKINNKSINSKVIENIFCYAIRRRENLDGKGII